MRKSTLFRGSKTHFFAFPRIAIRRAPQIAALGQANLREKFPAPVFPRRVRRLGVARFGRNIAPKPVGLATRAA
jgi:hypothetical protein